MASVRSPRRQLAPTVGHEVALDGVHIRAGVLEISGERTVSALVQRIYAMDFINDNAGCFANGGASPRTAASSSSVATASTSAPSPCASASRAGGTGPAKMALCWPRRRQRRGNDDRRSGSIIRASGDTAPGSDERPRHPIAQNIDPAAAQVELEAQRRKVLESGKDIVRGQRELNLTVQLPSLMTYGVYMAATKLKHYFEEHPMKVVSEAPISDIMCNKDASGRIAKWAIQISPYVPMIEYRKMHFDGSKLKEGLGAGVVLTSKGDHLRVPEIGMLKMPTWPCTDFTYKRLPDSSKGVSSTMCEQKMKPQMLCPSWAHLGKKFLPE
ncbi:hypothetical protein QYE76_059295 [Lolium multiflorum]|uniref:Uncharacterized protein n=1 Tax=Lolium multiflorum TaxID=4521 RepID=A0AAD8QEQ6_LOLMU|nr:hypothetical protein QYE76_059295 [Lolium multiflorum]